MYSIIGPEQGKAEGPSPFGDGVSTGARGAGGAGNAKHPARGFRPGGPTGDAPLGTTYEIGRRPPQKDRGEAVLRRLERYRMQGAARSLLPGERVSFCLRRVRPGEPGVKVWRGGTAAHYSGTIVCASVWACPVCAAKISERRRLELVRALEEWKAKGGRVLMLTQTVPHYVHQGVREVLERFQRARGLLRDRKPWKALSRALGLRGSVRALEVTHGANGWHVHSHELLFLEGGASAATSGEVLPNGEVAARVLTEWKRACRDAGLSEPNEHGIQVDDGEQAGRYAGKWGADLELTKGHIKRGREGNRSPWDLLRDVVAEDLAPGEISESGELFQEYAKAFKGRRQLVWSRGLRDLLGLTVEATDEELAGKVEEGAVMLGLLTREDWNVVVWAEKRGELLEVANRYGWEGVLIFIEKLKRWRRKNNGRCTSGKVGKACDRDQKSNEKTG